MHISKIDYRIKQIIYLFTAIFGVILFPLLILVFTGYTDKVNYGYAVPQVVKQLAQQSIFKNLITHLILVLSSIAIIFISTTFLFRVEFKEETIEKFKQNKIRNFFYQHFGFAYKNEWHIFIGYFLAILAFDSVVAYDFLENQRITLYPAYIVILPSIAVILLIARIFSQYDFKIIDTNIGNFIVLAYVSQFLYSIVSSGRYPVSQIANLVLVPESNHQTVFIVILSVIATALAITYLDWVIVRFLLQKKDGDHRTVIKKPRKTKLNIILLFGIPITALVIFLIFNPIYSEDSLIDFRETKFLKIATTNEVKNLKTGEDFFRFTNLDLGYTVEKPFWRWKLIQDLVKFEEEKTGIRASSGVLGGTLLELENEASFTIVVQAATNSDFTTLDDFFQRKFSGLHSKTGEEFQIINSTITANGTLGYVETISRINDFYQYQFYSIWVYEGKIYEIQMKTAGTPESITPYSLDDLNFIFNSFRILPTSKQ